MVVAFNNESVGKYVTRVAEGADLEDVVEELISTGRVGHSRFLLSEEELDQIVEAGTNSIGGLIRMLKVYATSPPAQQKAFLAKAGKALAMLSPGSAIRGFGGSKEASGTKIIDWAELYADLSDDAKEYLGRIASNAAQVNKLGVADDVSEEVVSFLSEISDAKYGSFSSEAGSLVRAIKKVK